MILNIKTDGFILMRTFMPHIFITLFISVFYWKPAYFTKALFHLIINITKYCSRVRIYPTLCAETVQTYLGLHPIPRDKRPHTPR